MSSGRGQGHWVEVKVIRSRSRSLGRGEGHLVEVKVTGSKSRSPAGNLPGAHGTLRFRGTSVEKHCSGTLIRQRIETEIEDTRRSASALCVYGVSVCCADRLSQVCIVCSWF